MKEENFSSLTVRGRSPNPFVDSPVGIISVVMLGITLGTVRFISGLNTLDPPLIVVLLTTLLFSVISWRRGIDITEGENGIEVNEFIEFFWLKRTLRKCTLVEPKIIISTIKILYYRYTIIFQCHDSTIYLKVSANELRRFVRANRETLNLKVENKKFHRRR